MRCLFKRSVVFILIAAILLSGKCPWLSVSAEFAIGSSFKIYANPNSTFNKNGCSYFYGMGNEATLQPYGDRVVAKNFHWGDGILYQPDGGLEGFHTRITVGHYVTSNSSDLAAEVIYVENGVKKISPAYGFTGYHADGRQVGTTGQIQTFDIGVYPDVIAVNVWNVMEDDWPRNNPPVSVPNHYYVQFDVVDEPVRQPTDYYIETRIKSSYTRGKGIAERASVAEKPISGETMPPYITPAPIGDSPVVPLGYGASFMLYSSNNDGLSSVEPPYHLGDGDRPVLNERNEFAKGPLTIEDTAQFSNYGRGVTSITLGTGSFFSRTCGNTDRTCALIDSPNGSSVTYIPKAGLLTGVETKVEYLNNRLTAYAVVDAEVRYDGGKIANVPVVTSETEQSNRLLEVGVYKDLESVTFKVTGGWWWYVSECLFTVVNENPGQPVTYEERKFEKQDIPQIIPPPPSDTVLPEIQEADPVCINEICTNNKPGIGTTDSFGEYSDWIELYNTSDQSVDIGGYSLSDNPSNPWKWHFPSATIPARGFMVVYASKRDIVNETEIHTNFSLSKDGETVTLSNRAGHIVDVMDTPVLTANYSIGRYPDGGESKKILFPTLNSKNAEEAVVSGVVAPPEFSAESGFYENAFDLTLSSKQGTTVYYTLDGSVPSPANVARQDIELSYTGTTATVDAVAAIDNAVLVFAAYQDNRLKQIKFMDNLSVQANTQQQINFPADFTPTEGEEVRLYLWKNLENITPLADSADKDAVTLPKVDKTNGVTYICPRGNPIPVYDRTQEENGLSMIKYTTCNFAPKVKLDKGMVINAVAVDGEGNRSEVVSKAYFVGLNIQKDYSNLPVLSFTTGADNLLDQDINGNSIGDHGIFSNHQGRGKLWETKTHLSFFEGDGSLVLDQDCNINIRGNGARWETQKGIAVSAVGEYGKGSFEYDIFRGDAKSKVDGTPITSFKSFALRGGMDGSRSGGARYMDYAMQRLGDPFDMPWQAGRGCVVFINGEYWGTYCLQEKVGVDYVEAHYGIPAEDAIVFKYTNLPMGDTTHFDYDPEFLKDYNWLKNTDFSIEENYQQLTAKFDVDQIIRYYALQLAIGNIDEGGFNFAFFRSRHITDEPYQDGKWRFLLYDLDAGFHDYDPKQAILDRLENFPYLKAFATNPTLKARIVNSLINIGLTDYSIKNVLNETQYWQDEIQPLAQKQKERWDYDVSNANWRFTFAITTYPMWRIYRLREYYNLTGALTHLNVRVNDSSMGTVRVNGLENDYSKGSYTGWFINDYTTNLVAEPKPGYRFVCWEKSEGASLSSETETDTYVTIPDNGARVTAVFEEIGQRITCFSYQDGEADENKPFYPATDGDLTAELSFLYDGIVPHNIGGIAKTPINAPKTIWTAGNGPDDSSAWQIKLSTKGYQNILFSAKQKSTGAGPAYWGLAYRIGPAGEFTVIADSEVKIVGKSDDSYKALEHSYTDFQLPPEVDNQQEVYIRIYMTKNLDASGRELIQNNGNTSINNIEFRGESI